MEADAIVIACIAALPPTIAALAAWRKLSEKSDAIHVLVNSNLTQVKADLARALTEISVLKKALKRK